MDDSVGQRILTRRVSEAHCCAQEEPRRSQRFTESCVEFSQNSVDLRALCGEKIEQLSNEIALEV